MKVKKYYLAIVAGLFILNCSNNNISHKDKDEIASVLKAYYSDSKKADYEKKYELISKEDACILNKKALIEKWAHDLYFMEFISIKDYKKGNTFVKVNINVKICSVLDGKEKTAIIPVYLRKESDAWKIIYQNDLVKLLDSKIYPH